MYIYDPKLSGLGYRRHRRRITLLPSQRYEYRDFLQGLSQPDQSLEQSMATIRTTLPGCSLQEFLDKPFKGLPACRMSLDRTRDGNEIETFFFPGNSAGIALVIGGVHGSELSGSEVAQLLVKRLFEDSAKGVKPHFNVVIIPVLFPDNAAIAKPVHNKPGDDNNTGRITDKSSCSLRLQASGREECVDPNRQFPTPGKRSENINPVDALGTRIEKENVALLAAVAFFKPGRIATIHAHKLPEKMAKDIDGPGIFADPITVGPSPSAVEVTQARDRTTADCALAKKMAERFLNEYKAITRIDGSDRIPGNWVKDGKATVCVYGSKASSQCGVSLGQWGPRAIPGVRDPITIITVEVRHYYPTTAAGKRGGGKTGGTEAGAKNRLNELRAYTTALRDVFLETP